MHTAGAGVVRSKCVSHRQSRMHKNLKQFHGISTLSYLSPLHICCIIDNNQGRNIIVFTELTLGPTSAFNNNYSLSCEGVHTAFLKRLISRENAEISNFLNLFFYHNITSNVITLQPIINITFILFPIVIKHKSAVGCMYACRLSGRQQATLAHLHQNLVRMIILQQNQA